jgi:transcriptional regulator with XRE-family HTH domain
MNTEIGKKIDAILQYNSARISQYETRIHEPHCATAEKLTTALNVPLAYFFL